MADKQRDGRKVIAENRRARFEYAIEDTWEAGLELRGSEVKSLRKGHVTIADSYASPEGSDIYLLNADIPEYLQANQFNHERRRPRRLLLHRKEISKMLIAVQREGMTLIPLKLYFNDRGRAKLEIALAKGKKLHDKRETSKERDWNRQRQRLLRDKG